MDIQPLLDNKPVFGVISAIAGGLFVRVFAVIRNRTQEFEYTVRHDRVGISLDDQVFGSVKATWQGNDLTNLYSSTVTITNNTRRDFKNVILKVHTADTLLLSERAEIVGSTYAPVWTDSFKTSVHVASGEKPTDLQSRVYRHNREYELVALNRGQQAKFQYLTTQPDPKTTPSVWVDIQQEGLRAKLKVVGLEVHGVPIQYALATGLVACLAIFVGLQYLVLPFSLGSAAAMLTGLVATSIGAWVWKTSKAALRFFVH